MKQIVTGKAPISFITLAAILSLSLVVNLPGLAITPMLDTLNKVFPHSTQLEAQLLTTLPNVLIIPFVLLSGKFSETKHKSALVIAGLVIFSVCAIAYLFAKSMTALIIISCLLGAGTGIIIPFSTGLLADTFAGSYKMREMGMQSGIANLTLVVATYVVGWLQHGNWHLPFVVYLVAVIPLALAPFLKGIPKSEENVAPATDNKPAQTEAKQTAGEIINGVRYDRYGFSTSRTVSLFMTYLSITFLTIVISYYCPFLAEKHNWGDSLTGTVTALYFLFIFLPGFFLMGVVKVLKGYTYVVSAICVTIGLALFAFVPEQWTLCIGAVLCGFGYGVIQPLVYDKATLITASPAKATLALSIILSANYIAIVIAPFIIDGVRSIFGDAGTGTFAFKMNFVLSIVFLIISLVRRQNFSFGIPTSYYSAK